MGHKDVNHKSNPFFHRIFVDCWNSKRFKMIFFFGDLDFGCVNCPTIKILGQQFLQQFFISYIDLQF